MTAAEDDGVHIHTSVTPSDFGLACQKASNGGLLIQGTVCRTKPSVCRLGWREHQKASDPLCWCSDGIQTPTRCGRLFLSVFSLQWGQRVVNCHLFVLATYPVGCKILVPLKQQGDCGRWWLMRPGSHTVKTAVCWQGTVQSRTTRKADMLTTQHQAKKIRFSASVW